MRARRAKRFGRLVLVGACLLGVFALPRSGSGAGEEDPGRRDINEKYLAPDLDVDHWLGVFEGESREIFRSRAAIVGALELTAGMRVADVGAGTGLFVGPFAQAVGSEGRVYAVEISPRFLDHLRRRSEQAGLHQVEVVAGGAHATGLPAAAVDLVFLCDVYHHFEDPKSMLADLQRALRPGGRLVLIDFDRVPGKTRKWVVRHVRADKAAFIAEIAAAGFVFEEEVAIEGLRENYMLRFRRP
jgi:predicted methyltransferase